MVSKKCFIGEGLELEIETGVGANLSEIMTSKKNKIKSKNKIK